MGLARAASMCPRPVGSRAFGLSAPSDVMGVGGGAWRRGARVRASRREYTHWTGAQVLYLLC
jgi:hypothetical protein